MYKWFQRGRVRFLGQAISRLEGGYLLPLTIVLGLVITSLSAYTLAAIASQSADVKNQMYGQIANDAAQAGILRAKSCLAQATTTNVWNNTTTILTPNTDCSGTVTQSGQLVLDNANTTEKLTSKYEVSACIPVAGATLVTSTGRTLLNDVEVSKKISKTTVTGLTVTSGGTQDCIPSPVCNSLSQTSGIAGTPITINGKNFTSDSQVKIGDTLATITSVSDTQLIVTVPAIVSSGAVAVVINTLDKSVTCPDTFTFTAAPTCGATTTFSSYSGKTGDSVTINGGTNFVNGNTTVKVGDASPVPAVVNSATSLTFTVPTISTGGAKNIVITTTGGSVTCSSTFLYYAQPTYTSISPISGTAGTSATITGTNFISGNTTVTVGGVPATITSFTTSQLIVTIPTISNSGAQDVVITTPGGQAKGTGVFTYTITAPAPTCSSFSPTSGKTGTSVTITGTNFVPGTTSTVGGVSATTTFNSSTSLTVTIPTILTSGSKNIVITTAGGSVTCATAFTYTAPPTFGSISPSSGKAGTSATITGTNFVSGTTVTIGGVAVTNMTVNSATKLTITIPTISTSGTKNVVITTSAGSVTAANAFTYYLAPTYTGISPDRGGAGTSATITGNNFVSGNTTVTVGGVSAATTYNSATQLTVTIPSISTSGAKDVIITTAGGTVTATGVFNYYLPPTYSGISIPQGKTGLSVNISGSNFTSGSTTVTIGESVANTIFNNTSSLTVTIPVIATEGAKNIVITTLGGSTTATNAFTYYNSYSPSIINYTAAGLGTYTIPSWANYVDVVLVGAGGGGHGSQALCAGDPGLPGSWGSSVTLTRGVSITWGTMNINYTVGTGGIGGPNGLAIFNPAPGTAGTLSSVSASGWAGFSGAGGSGGQNVCPVDNNGSAEGPGNLTYNGVTYTGGTYVFGAQNGSPPGGGGGGGRSGFSEYGGNGANGSVWFRAYQ